MASVKTLDASDLTIAASGSSIVISPSSRIRCTLEVSKLELRHTRSIKVLLTNDCDQPLRITLGVCSGVQAQLLTGLELMCAPRDELSFEYNVPVFSLRSRRAFALVETANDRFGFLGPDLDEAVLPVAGAFVVAAAAGCAALVLGKPESGLREQTQPRYGDAEETPLAEPVDTGEPDEIIAESTEVEETALADPVDTGEPDEIIVESTELAETALADPVDTGEPNEIIAEPTELEETALADPVDTGEPNEIIAESTELEETPLVDPVDTGEPDEIVAESTELEETPLADPVDTGEPDEIIDESIEVEETPLVDPVGTGEPNEIIAESTELEETPLADPVNVQFSYQYKIEDFVECDRADDPNRADVRNVIEEPDFHDDPEDVDERPIDEGRVETARSTDGKLEPPAIRDKSAAAVASLSSSSSISRQFAAINVGDAAVVGSIECVDRRPLNLLFVAKVLNQVDEPLMCSVVGEARDGEPILFPDYFWVQPQSAAAVEINTSVQYPWKLDRLVLRMQNTGLSCTAETIVPVPLAVRAMHVVAMALLMVLFGAITYAWLTRPHIQAFAAPQSVVAGSVARVSYETQGRGTTAYLVSNDSGTVQRGQLPMGRHEISFRTSNRPQLYRVLLTVDGFAGGTSVEQDVRALALQRAPLARTSIDVLEVDPPIANAGVPFEVRYVLSDAGAAKSGTVSVFDSVGFPVVSGPINASGVTSLLAPNVAEPTTFRVALDVSQNGLHSQAATGLLVMPKANNGQNAVAEQNFSPDQLLQISPQSPRSQQTLTVRPLRYPNAMSITLQNDRGEPIGSQNINSGNGVARFLLPVVDRERKMTVIASYVLNGAQHVAIKSIVVRPTAHVL